MDSTNTKYTNLKTKDSYSIYFDESERKDILGSPSYGICDITILVIIHLLWILTLPLTWCCSFKIIPQYERLVVFRVGRLLPLKGPGLTYTIPCVDQCKNVDMRMRAFKVAPQEIVTIDRGIIKIGADVQYRIADPLAANTSIRDMDHSLRNHMNKNVSEWGIEIARFELTHSTLIKDSGGVDPSTGGNDEHGGHAAIINLVKSFASSSTSTAQMPGMLPQNFIPSSMMPFSSSPAQQSSNQVALLSPNELFSIVKGVINEDLCSKVSAVYEFHVSNQTEVKIWTVDLKNSPGCVINGQCENIVDVKFKLNEDCFRDIFYGKLSPTDAYMNGKLEVDGSLQSATRLEYLVHKMKGE